MNRGPVKRNRRAKQAVPTKPWWSRSVRQLAAVIFVGLLSLVLLFLTVMTIVDLREPTVWGTFVEEGCENPPGISRYPRVCRPYGEWRSDDGSITRDRIYLDGWSDEDGTTRTSFQPSGINNDDDNNIVHSELMTTFAPWFVILFFGGVLAWLGMRLQMWRYSRSARIRPRKRAVDIST